jgi:hypothetical protein
MLTQRLRFRALGLQVEELAAFVPQVGDDAEQEPDERERKRDQSCSGERDQRAAG